MTKETPREREKMREIRERERRRPDERGVARENSFLCINPEKNTFHLPICFRSGRY